MGTAHDHPLSPAALAPTDPVPDSAVVTQRHLTTFSDHSASHRRVTPSLCARACRGSGRGGAGGGDRRRGRARPAGARGGRRARRRGAAARRPACCGWGDAREEAGALAPTLVVLAALLVLGDGCERAGLFDALAARLARGARGSGSRLLALVVVAAAGVTAVLGLDATVVLLTPAAFAAAAKARLGGRPAGLRVRAPGQLGVAAAADLEPHEPAGVPGERAVVRALRGADGAAVGGGDRDRVGRAAVGVPPRARGARARRRRTRVPALPRAPLVVLGAHARRVRRRRAARARRRLAGGARARW